MHCVSQRGNEEDIKEDGKFFAGVVFPGAKVVVLKQNSPRLAPE